MTESKEMRDLLEEEVEQNLAWLRKELVGQPPELRKCMIDEFIEFHFEVYGEPPSASILDELSDNLMLEILTDPDKDKVQKYEYSILSDDQWATRRRKEMTGFNTQTYGSDGKDYRKPTRRPLSAYEEWLRTKAEIERGESE